MSDSWTEYAVRCSDGEMSGPYRWEWKATEELERINAVIAGDPTLAHITAKVVTREIEAGEWSE